MSVEAAGPCLEKLPSFLQNEILTRLDFPTRPNHNYSKDALDHFMKCLTWARFRVQKCSIILKEWTLDYSTATRLIGCRHLELGFYSFMQLRHMLTLVTTDTNKLIIINALARREQIIDNVAIPEEILGLKHLKNATIVHVDATWGLTDETLLKLNNWIDGNVRDDFMELRIHYTRKIVRHDILKGTGYYEWNRVFRHENPDFCQRFRNLTESYRVSKCYQVRRADGKQEATIELHREKFLFVVTGRMACRDNKWEMTFETPY
ncbi:unnamed protein product [Caenorhabditis bovis]|uniref:Uncharacterized protein n=1 Tax=Caenorhabditis bovis TaxID=2654633 RepID=A0A8S1FDZ4_9PELO|nr:unnamed protein product [Caenorhabditis bovis]